MRRSRHVAHAVDARCLDFWRLLEPASGVMSGAAALFPWTIGLTSVMISRCSVFLSVVLERHVKGLVGRYEPGVSG